MKEDEPLTINSIIPHGKFKGEPICLMTGYLLKIWESKLKHLHAIGITGRVATYLLKTGMVEPK